MPDIAEILERCRTQYRPHYALLHQVLEEWTQAQVTCALVRLECEKFTNVPGSRLHGFYDGIWKGLSACEKRIDDVGEELFAGLASIENTHDFVRDLFREEFAEERGEEVSPGPHVSRVWAAMDFVNRHILTLLEWNIGNGKTQPDVVIKTINTEAMKAHLRQLLPLLAEIKAQRETQKQTQEQRRNRTQTQEEAK